jgi:hypothetical protein
MKFHDHPLIHREYLKRIGAPKNLRPADRDALLRAQLFSTRDADVIRNVGCQLETELMWVDSSRPYYDVYPVVHEPFTKVSLDKVMCRDLHLPVPQLLLRFPVGHELHKARSALVAEHRLPWAARLMPGSIKFDGEQRFLSITIHDGDQMNQIHAHTVSNFILREAATVNETLDLSEKFGESTTDDGMILDVIRVVCAVCLLDRDTDLVEALCLPQDQHNFDEASDDKLREKLLKRAKLQGHRGFALGKQLTAAPGYRRPHFGIRWCGPGGKEPKLRPIKGCMINGHLIVDVPTGNLKEVEETCETEPTGS